MAFNVSAHPASDMKLTYNTDTQELDVSITHSVSDPQAHYIYILTIRKNDEIYKSYDYNSQPTSSSFTYAYIVNASEGDILEVYTDCNYGGSLTEKIKVKSGITSTGDSSNLVHDIAYYLIFGIPFIVYIGIITLIIFILTAGLAILKRKGKINYPIKWHFWLAYLAILLAFIHGILGILLYI